MSSLSTRKKNNIGTTRSEGRLGPAPAGSRAMAAGRWRRQRAPHRACARRDLHACSLECLRAMAPACVQNRVLACSPRLLACSGACTHAVSLACVHSGMFACNPACMHAVRCARVQSRLLPCSLPFLRALRAARVKWPGASMQSRLHRCNRSVHTCSAVCLPAVPRACMQIRLLPCTLRCSGAGRSNLTKIPVCQMVGRSNFRYKSNQQNQSGRGHSGTRLLSVQQREALTKFEVTCPRSLGDGSVFGLQAQRSE